MKKFLFALLLAAGAVSCVTKENFENQVGDPDLEITPPTVNGDPAVINADVFDLINLDYPGLEQVKRFYEDGLFSANRLSEKIKYRAWPMLELFVEWVEAGEQDAQISALSFLKSITK